MNVIVRLRCMEVPLLRDDYELNIKEYVKLKAALKDFYKQYDVEPLTFHQLIHAAYLINNVAAHIDAVLNEGDVITVIRMLEGG